MSAPQFEKEREALIQKLEGQAQFIQSVQNENYRLGLLNNEQLDRLQAIARKNSKFLHKLKTNEFEIAIVGLEKAGKSTFANALIGNYAVPSAPERCTFTSTRLVYGQDRGIVEFYTEPEFNQIFQNLLKEIYYPDAENANFRTLSLDDFETYFHHLEEVNEALYRHHLGKTDEEIRDILKNRDKLTLDGGVKHFSEDELYSDVFQSYIKGDKYGQNVDTSKPRSVKRVEIESSKLEKLPTAIIYDVPGFDSPTKIHLRQTEERLKNADIIILVTNVGRNPSLQGTSLSIINKNVDNDGVALKDKLFVFGNQLDKANSLEQATGNIETLKNDVEKYKIGDRKRVFAGSALKYLSELGKANDIYTENYSIEANIDAIRDDIIEYYQTERFNILKTKIGTNQNGLINLFKEVSEAFEQSEVSQSYSDEMEKSNVTLQAYQSIEESFISGLETLRQTLKQEIYEDKPLSNKFIADVMSPEYIAEISEEEFNEILKEQDNSVTPDIAAEKINHVIRGELHHKFLQNYVALVHQLTTEKSAEFENRLLDTVIHSVANDNNDDIYDAVKEIAQKFIQQVTEDVAPKENQFDYLIEHFSRNLFDILIAHPMLSQDRHNKFENTLNELKYLDMFYSESKGKLFNVLLAQKNENILDVADLTFHFARAKTMLQDYIKYSGGDGVAAAAFTTVKILDKFISKANSEIVVSDVDIENTTADCIRSSTANEVINEINVDIANLKAILVNAVVPAINLELAFFNALDKQIQLLMDVKASSSEGAKKLNVFLMDITPIVKRKELEGINEKMEIHRLKRELMAQINAYL